MKTEIIGTSDAEIKRAIEALQDGQLVAMPTETVYGLAGDAFNTSAVTRIFQAKERPTFDPLIVHVSQEILPAPEHRLQSLSELHLVDLARLPLSARSTAEALLQAFWPGPFTLVMAKSAFVPDLVTSGLDTVAVRMPRHPIAQRLIADFAKPLAAPSANRFGRISPTRAEDVMKELQNRIPLIVDGGPCEVGLESTVLKVEDDGRLILLRPGAISLGEIERVAGQPVQHLAGTPGPATGGEAPLLAPGMLESHYAPSKALYLLPDLIENLSDERLSLFLNEHGLSRKRTGWLILGGEPQYLQDLKLRLENQLGKEVVLLSLSVTGKEEEMAQKLFLTLRALDESSAQVLIAEPCQGDHGIRYAIADRLRRASTR